MDPNLLTTLKHFVTVAKLHPVLVNFTAALIPVSVGSDALARFTKSEALRNTAWWTLLYAVLITPFTAISGWLFWMKDDIGVQGMAIHKWLGTSVAVLLIGLFLWRWKFRKQGKWISYAYLAVGIIFVGLLIYQGHLGGTQVFSDM